MSEWKRLLNRGLQGEKLVREWLKLRGFYVLPTSLIENGGAPALEGHVRKVIASNNLVVGDGSSFWAEVKTHQRSTMNRKYQREEHGIPIRLWEQYMEGQELTGIPGCLFILELKGRRILEGRLNDIAIGSRQTVGIHHPPSGPQVFFDVRRFHWYSLETLALQRMLPEDNPPRVVRPWEGDRRFPIARQLPMEGL